MNIGKRYKIRRFCSSSFKRIFLYKNLAAKVVGVLASIVSMFPSFFVGMILHSRCLIHCHHLLSFLIPSYVSFVSACFGFLSFILERLAFVHSFVSSIFFFLIVYIAGAAWASFGLAAVILLK